MDKTACCNPFEAHLSRSLKCEQVVVETDNLKMSGYIFVCSDEAARHEGVELPMEEDGTLLLSVLQSQFEGASGLKYRSEFVCVHMYSSNGRKCRQE